MNDRFRLRAWNKEEKEMYYDVEGQYDNGCNGMGTMDHQCLTDLLEDERPAEAGIFLSICGFLDGICKRGIYWIKLIEESSKSWGL